MVRDSDTEHGLGEERQEEDEKGEEQPFRLHSPLIPADTDPKQEVEVEVPEERAPIAAPREGPRASTELLPHTQHLLANAVAVKTRARHTAVQTKWKAYVHSRGMQPAEATEAVFADFLATEQHQHDLAPGSLQARIAAVNDLRVMQGQTRFVGGLAARVVQGTAVLKPRPAGARGTFDLDLLITFLKTEKGVNSDLSNNELLGKLGALLEMHGLRAADTVSSIWKGSIVSADQHDMQLMLLPKETHKRKFFHRTLARKYDARTSAA
jgi:hypothetical protein